MKKKVVVLDHGGGRLANQLWTDAAIYAYAVEKGYEFESWAGFEYFDYFEIPPIRNWFMRMVFFNPLTTKIKSAFWKKWMVRRIFKKVKYKTISLLIKYFNKGSVVQPGDQNFFFSPSKFANDNSTKMLSLAEGTSGKYIYFYGYGFRNPFGLKKYRNEVCSYFSVKDKYLHLPEKTIAELRNNYKNIIGVHFRQGDYRTVPRHHIWRYTDAEVRNFLDSYLSWSGKNKNETVFLIASDENFNKKEFDGLNIKISAGNEVEDLVALSLTDIVIGSKSTYGDFAAYYGNIPFVVFERGGIEWEYYNGKTEYFENKKSHLNSELPTDQYLASF
jgi:hypothetical protein